MAPQPSRSLHLSCDSSLSLSNISITPSSIHRQSNILCSFMVRAATQDLFRGYEDIVLPGTAYPIALGILLCCQLNMHFCNLCGMSLSLALWQSLKCKCWYFVRDIFSPIYDYVNAQLKRPPDGIITSSIILSTMLIVNLITMIHGLCFISLFWYHHAREKHHSSSSSSQSNKRAPVSNPRSES